MNAICLQIKNVSMEMRAAENIHTKTGVCLWYGSFHFGMHMNFSWLFCVLFEVGRDLPKDWPSPDNMVESCSLFRKLVWVSVISENMPSSLSIFPPVRKKPLHKIDYHVILNIIFSVNMYVREKEISENGNQYRLLYKVWFVCKLWKIQFHSCLFHLSYFLSVLLAFSKWQRIDKNKRERKKNRNIIETTCSDELLFFNG